MFGRMIACGLLIALGACGGDPGDVNPSSAPSGGTAASERATSTTSAPAGYELPIDAADVLSPPREVLRYDLVPGRAFRPDQSDQSWCGEGTPADIEGWGGTNVGYDHLQRRLSMEQTLWGWPDVASAEAAFDLAVDDVSCGTGTIEVGGVAVRFELEALDLGATFGDEAFAVAGSATPIRDTDTTYTTGTTGTTDTTANDTTPSSNIVLVTVRVENYLLQFAFSAPDGTTDAPDARIFVNTTTDRLRAALA